MTEGTSLTNFLSQQIKVSDKAFWSGMKAMLFNPNCNNVNLSQKAKQKLIEAIRYSVTCEEWEECASTIISWLKLLCSNSSYIDDNFSKEDQVFFNTLVTFTSQVMSKPCQQETITLKNDIINCFEIILTKENVIKNEFITNITKSLIVVFKNLDEVSSVIEKTLSLLYRLLNENDNLIPVIQACAQTLFDASKSVKSPKSQMQLFNLLWISEARIKDASFVHKVDAPFISSAHKIASKFNNGIKSFIISLLFQNTILPDNSNIGPGWLDIGETDLVLCYDEKIFNIPFDVIDGLDSENSTINLVVSPSYEKFSDCQNKNIIIKLQKKPSAKMITQIFARISRGESQPHLSDVEESEFEGTNNSNNSSNQNISNNTILTPIMASMATNVPQVSRHLSQAQVPPQPRNQQIQQQPLEIQNLSPPKKVNNVQIILPEKIDHISQQPRIPKSSIAMYYNHDAQPKSQSSQIDECLFTDEQSTVTTTTDATIKSSIPEPFPDPTPEPAPVHVQVSVPDVIAYPEIEEIKKNQKPEQKLTKKSTKKKKKQESESESDTEYENKTNIINSIESPPPPSIAMNVAAPSALLTNDENEIDLKIHAEEDEEKKNSSPKIGSVNNRRKQTYELSQDDFLMKHTIHVSEKVNAGIDAMTKQRLDNVDHFGEQIGRYVDTFKEDIKTTLRDREHGSIKQLDVSKQRFQINIQTFKKKEASMHQTLTGFEEETKQMSSKITEIQRRLRNEIQKHRLELEEELKNLRKIIRKNDKNDDEDESNSLDDSLEEPVHNPK